MAGGKAITLGAESSTPCLAGVKGGSSSLIPGDAQVDAAGILKIDGKPEDGSMGELVSPCLHERGAGHGGCSSSQGWGQTCAIGMDIRRRAPGTGVSLQLPTRGYRRAQGFTPWLPTNGQPWKSNI